MSKKNLVAVQTKLRFISAFILIILWNGAFADENRGNSDPLRFIGGAMTRAVLSTREDAKMEKKEVMRHLDVAREMLAAFLAQSMDSLPEPYSDDESAREDIADMLVKLELSRIFLEKGDLRNSHHRCKEARLKLIELRSRNGVVNLWDMVWRYNCAFHPIMHEVMHHPENAEFDEGKKRMFHQMAENADISLSALEAAMSHRRYKDATNLVSLIWECRKSLSVLVEIINKPQYEKIELQVRKVRENFINFASHEFSELK
ncbi:hypothetical protein JW926_12725 [Candidatus Sumerlaeota bacterium]|nr:hypothetical protein [Candidatus Sumerlaeota bacterium]